MLHVDVKNDKSAFTSTMNEENMFSKLFIKTDVIIQFG